MSVTSSLSASSDKGPTRFLRGPFPPLEWPTNHPKPRRHDWDSKGLSACELEYAIEKAENIFKGRPATHGNRLVQLADNRFRAEALRKWASSGARMTDQERRSYFQARCQARWSAKAQNGAPGAMLSLEDLRAGRPVQTCEAYTSTLARQTAEPAYEIRPAIPYRRLTGLDWTTDIRSANQESGSSDEGTDDSDEYSDSSDDDDSDQEEDFADFGKDDFLTEANRAARSTSRYFTVYQPYKDRIRNSSGQVPQRALFSPNDNITHSQTKTWMSLAEKERLQFRKLQHDTRHAGTDTSPYIPKTFGEYLHHKEKHVSLQGKQTQQNVQKKEEEVLAARQHLREGGAMEHALPAKPKIAQKLADLEREGKGTVVMGRPSIWTTECLRQAQIAWPERAELRASWHYMLRRPYDLPLSGKGIPWDKRKIAPFAKSPLYDMVFEHEADPLLEVPTEVDLSEVNDITAKLIAETEPANDSIE
ncbi:hypothetical protein SLS62_005717 [Diatrype stigma]|uniref:Uncharacterized protein n=1 Tax=Diatrype stigma TaxID=117547 RepID=A0AAN9UUH5_9PEZI